MRTTQSSHVSLVRFFIPRFAPGTLPRMLRIAAVVGVAGGIYGALHDAVTSRLSPEYFEKIKFSQFAWANIGLPAWAFSIEIGFIAGGAAAFCAGWFIARAVVPSWPPHQAWRPVVASCALILGCAIGGAFIGAVMGKTVPDSESVWWDFAIARGIENVPAFFRVVCIHYGSYVGALIGLVLALLGLHRRSRRVSTGPNKA